MVGERALTADIAARLAAGAITRIRVIGQGTAAIAGQSAAALLDELSDGELDVDAVLATELSGFQLRLDMSDTLAIAVSQSGTTTDTNRTVDLLRAAAAAVIGIVNRRGSDLVDKADGVLYTSDGRDIEMSVASTKAFYAQVAAGALLACAITEAAGVGSTARRAELLASLRELPEAMERVYAKRDEIADAARRLAPPKRYWAVVGNGPNRVAAEEVRIKLSELCYKSIACRRHRGQEAHRPVVRAADPRVRRRSAREHRRRRRQGDRDLPGPQGDADRDRRRGRGALTARPRTITVPAVDPALGFVLSAMVGHLFGYEAALAIDGSARPAARGRARRSSRPSPTSADGDVVLAVARASRSRARPSASSTGSATTSYDGHLEASTAVRLVGLLRDLTSPNPVEQYAASSGRVGTPAALVDELVLALTRAIEELTRPVDAIKHQAKTVTVGISRSDEGVVDRALVQATLARRRRARRAHATARSRCSPISTRRSPRSPASPATRIDDDTISIVDRGGISRDLPSRVDTRLATGRHQAPRRRVARGAGRRAAAATSAR